jgi:hypothetical protein
VATKKLGAALPTRQRPTSNIQWKKMKKQTYDLEERLLEYSVRIIKNDILEETEELIKIFVKSINTAEKKQR